MARWISIAQRTASTALANSTRATVARGFDDAAAVFGDLRIDNFGSFLFKRRECTFLVNAHQATVASHVGCEDGG
jgi:hypothetical protein